MLGCGGAAGPGRGDDRAAGPARDTVGRDRWTQARSRRPSPTMAPVAAPDERPLQDRRRRIAGAGRSPWCSSRRWASPLWSVVLGSNLPTGATGPIDPGRPLRCPGRDASSRRDRVGPAGRARQRRRGMARTTARARTRAKVTAATRTEPHTGTTRPAATCLRGRISAGRVGLCAARPKAATPSRHRFVHQPQGSPMEPSTPTTKRHRRWRTAALIVVVVVDPGHHGQRGRRDRHARRGPPVGAGGRQGRPVPGRARPGPLRAGDRPGHHRSGRVRRTRRRPRREPVGCGAVRFGIAVGRRVGDAHDRAGTGRDSPTRRPAVVRSTSTSSRTTRPSSPTSIKDTWCASAGVQIVLAILGHGDTRTRCQRELQCRVHEWESYKDSHNGDWGPSAMSLALADYGVAGLPGPRLQDPPGRPARCGQGDREDQLAGHPHGLARRPHVGHDRASGPTPTRRSSPTPRSPAPTSSTRGTRTSRASGARPTRPGRSRTRPR